MGADCKSAGSAFSGSNPLPTTSAVGVVSVKLWELRLPIWPLLARLSFSWDSFIVKKTEQKYLLLKSIGQINYFWGVRAYLVLMSERRFT